MTRICDSVGPPSALRSSTISGIAVVLAGLATAPAIAADSGAATITAPASLIAALGGGGVGFAAKWMLEQLGARRASMRKFAESSTDQVVRLAQDHYWSLANYSGMLAELLTSYINERALHLMIDWGQGSASGTDICIRLDELAREAANRAFPAFCLLVTHFEDFQFQGSRTYLLKSHFAGEACKRLYNVVIEALPHDVNTPQIVAAVHQSRRANGADGTEATHKVADLSSDDQFSASKEAFNRWLRSQTPQVVQAAEALRAYSELLNHELALLYQAFFERSARSRLRGCWPFHLFYRSKATMQGGDEIDRYRQAAHSGSWPGVLSASSLAVLEVAKLRSGLLKPLPGIGLVPAAVGSAGTKATDSHRERPEAAERPPPPKKEPPQDVPHSQQLWFGGRHADMAHDIASGDQPKMGGSLAGDDSEQAVAGDTMTRPTSGGTNNGSKGEEGPVDL